MWNRMARSRAVFFWEFKKNDAMKKILNTQNWRTANEQPQKSGSFAH